MSALAVPVTIGVLVLATAILSGVFGMAGGLILLAALLALLPVPTAMLVHGAAQATANGFRAVLLWRHVRPALLPPYLLGAALASGALAWLLWVPPRGAILITVGAFPWLARYVRGLRGLSIERPGPAVACGAIVTSAQVLAGASGPLLDVFYLNTSLDRFAIIANKALTQTLGHALKLAYYGALIGAAAPAAELLPVIPLALLGTWLGRRLLERISEGAFRSWSGRIVLTLGATAMIAGVWDLAASRGA